MLNSYLCPLISGTTGSYNLRSSWSTLSVLKFGTEVGKVAFSYSAPSTWNSLQAEPKPGNPIILDCFLFSF